MLYIWQNKLPERQLHIAIIGINIDCRKRGNVFSAMTAEKNGKDKCSLTGLLALPANPKGCGEIKNFTGIP